MLNKLGVNEAGAKAQSPDILIDSGAAAHVFKHEDQFISWDKDFDPTSITFIMADGTKCSNVKGRGTVSLYLSTATKGDKQQAILYNVYFMPSLNHSGIISIQCGMMQDMAFHFKKGCCVLYDEELKSFFKIASFLFHMKRTRKCWRSF